MGRPKTRSMQQRFTLDPGNTDLIRGLVERHSDVWPQTRDFVHEALARIAVIQARGEFVALALPEPKEYANWRVLIDDITRAETMAARSNVSMAALLCNAIRQYLPEALAHVEEGVELTSYSKDVSLELTVNT